MFFVVIGFQRQMTGFLIILSEDISISFSKKRYRASVQVTAPLGTSIVTVRASSGNSKSPVHYYIASVNGKPFNAKTALFDMDPVTGIYNIFIQTSFVNKLSLVVHYKLFQPSQRRQ